MPCAPLFSVVTVTLNCASAAVKTARSVLAQEFGDYEYIIKDGGSTDDTVWQLQRLGIANITVSSDSGIYDAMNQALALCKGRYVYFLNAGDTFYSNDVLARVATELEPNTAIIYGNLHLAPINKYVRPPRRLSRYYLFRKNLNHQSWMAQLDVYKALGGFNLQYRYVADQDFLWRAVLSHNLPTQYLDVVLATFMYGGASTRRSAREQVREERWHLLRHFYSPWEIIFYGAAGLYFLNRLKARIWDMRYPIN